MSDKGSLLAESPTETRLTQQPSCISMMWLLAVLILGWAGHLECTLR